MAQEAYAPIRLTFWRDPDIKRPLTLEQKALLLYLFSSPHSNMIGLYYLPIAYIQNETGLDEATITDWIEGALAPFVSYDHRTEEVLVHRGIDHRVDGVLSANDKRLKAARKMIEAAHSSLLVHRLLELHADWPFGIDAPQPPPSPEGDTGRASEAPSERQEAPPKPLRSQEQEQEQKQEQEQEQSFGAGAPPTKPWSERAGLIWQQRMGGTAAFGRIGAALKPLADQHGGDEVLYWWDRYLTNQVEHGEAKYATPEAFAQRYGAWKEELADGQLTKADRRILEFRKSLDEIDLEASA